MTTILVTKLIGAALDYAVAMAEKKDADCHVTGGNVWYGRQTSGFVVYSPSTNWSQGGPILEKEGISVELSLTHPGWFATSNRGCYAIPKQRRYGDGETPLIAAMRCFVESKFGDRIDIPDGE